MMQRCSSSHCNNMVGPCTCGLFHSQSSSFSMLFSMHPPSSNQHRQSYNDETADFYSFTSSSSAAASSVDCTLSLGTPSTRLTTNNNEPADKREKRSSCMSNFCWDLLGSKHSAPQQPSKSSHRSGNGSAANSNADPLLARRCANCDTTSTPLWRNGPRGPKSLCNACGIRFKKEERRATAAANTNGGGGAVETQHMVNSSSWVHHSQAQRMPNCLSAYGNEFRFIEDDDRDSETGIPFLSWRLNVTDRPSLVHDFTR